MKTSGLAKVVLASTVACVIAVNAGCDDTRSADRRARAAIEESRLARAKGADGLEQAQQLLSKAASESDASSATKAHAKAMLAHAEMDAAAARVSDPTNGVNQGNREIARLLWEIGQLGQQIRTSNNLVASYRQFEPKAALQEAQKQVDAASGGAGAAVWTGQDPVAIPTLAAAQQQVTQLQQQVEQQQKQIAELKTQQQQLLQQADQTSRAADAAGKTQQAIEQFKQASGLRKQAADAANQADVQNAKLAQLQQDLAIAQAKQQAVAAAIDQFKKLADTMSQGWKSVEQQIQKQTALATQILAGGGAATTKSNQASIAGKAAALDEQSKKTKEAYDKAVEQLTSAAKDFEAAASAATQLGTEFRTASGNLPGDNAMKKAMDTLVQTYNPNIFKLDQANATLELAELEASQAQTLAERQKLVASLGDTLKNAGLTLPKELAAAEGDLKAVAKSADDHFAEAAESYSSISEGGGDETNKNAGKAGRIFALYGRSLLARSMGDAKAAEYLKDAKAQRDLVLQDNKAALGALPSELVPAGATTAPSATSIPATPATSAPAEAPASAPAAQ